MKKYIISQQVKINGEFKTRYFQNLKISDSPEAMNLFAGYWVSVKMDAARFYDKTEATKFAELLHDSTNCKETIIIPAAGQETAIYTAGAISRAQGLLTETLKQANNSEGDGSIDYFLQQDIEKFVSAPQA